MKISNSKKELALIISENGGWRDVAANWAAMDGLRNGTYNVAAYGEIPVYEKVKKWHKPSDFTAYHEDWFEVSNAIKNFHQTILSREEYFHLHPAPDADGWIELDGGECPLENGMLIDVKKTDGSHELAVHDPQDRIWNDKEHRKCIVAYRLHKTEQSIGELCDNVTEENKHEHVDCNPTIEQLAVDYRDRKDYADRKQAEADAAKADAEAKLAEMVAAGKAIGLALSVADVQP